MIDTKRPAIDYQRIDWNSLFLLLLLTVPTVVMVIILLVYPVTSWAAQIPYTSLEILGSFASFLLAIFIYARYKDRPGTLYISAGLIGMGIIEGFLTIATPQSTGYVWLHSLAGAFGSLFFLIYVYKKFYRTQTININDNVGQSNKWLVPVCIAVALGLGILSITFSRFVPQMIDGERFTVAAWIFNSIPVALFLFAGVTLFYQYRKSGARDMLLYTAIVIFLFQSSEVFYFARMWSLIWWFWQALRLAIYLAVLGYVLKEYIQTNDSLSEEIKERQKAEAALRKAEADWRNSFNSLDEVMIIVNRDYTIERINDSGLGLLNKTLPQVTGEKCYRLFHNGDNPVPDCPCRRSFRYKKVATVERYSEQFALHLAIKSAPIVMLTTRCAVTTLANALSLCTSRNSRKAPALDLTADLISKLKKLAPGKIETN